MCSVGQARRGWQTAWLLQGAASAALAGCRWCHGTQCCLHCLIQLLHLQDAVADVEAAPLGAAACKTQDDQNDSTGRQSAVTVADPGSFESFLRVQHAGLHD